MWLTILKTFWPAIPATILTAGIALILHNADVSHLKSAQEKALNDQSLLLQSQCEKEKQVTSEVSLGYQNKISALATQLDAIKRVRTRSRCIVPVTNTSSGHHAAPGTGQPSGSNAGVTSDALYDFSAEAEKYRLQLIGCQSFIFKTWELKNGSPSTKR